MVGRAADLDVRVRARAGRVDALGQGVDTAQGGLTLNLSVLAPVVVLPVGARDCFSWLLAGLGCPVAQGGAVLPGAQQLASWPWRVTGHMPAQAHRPCARNTAPACATR